MMSNRVLVVGISALLSMAAPAAAQVQWGDLEPYPCLPYEPENTIDWPPGSQFGDAQDFGRLVLAELNGDNGTEAVVLAGGVPVVLWKVALYDAPEPILFDVAADPIAVKDIAALPGLGPDGTAALAMTDSRGLFLVTYDGDEFDEPVVINDPSWINAMKVHAEYVNADSYLDIVGIAADKRTILIRYGSASGFEPGTPILLEFDLLDVTTVDWEGNGIPDLAVLGKRALRIYLPGSQVTFPYLSSTGCIARFRAADVLGGERLAWTRRIAPNSGASQLLVLGQGVQEGPWPLTFDMCGDTITIQPTAMLAGNYDGNANDELLLVQEATHMAIVLANLGLPEIPEPGQPQPLHFDPSDPQAFDIVALKEPFPSDPANIGIPAFGEVDGEEPDDLVFPVSSTEKIEVFLSLPSYRTGIMVGFHNSAHIIQRETEYGPGVAGSGGELRFAFWRPPKYRLYNALEMIVWGQPSTSADTGHDALNWTRHPLIHVDEQNELEYEYQWIPLHDTAAAAPAFPDGDCWFDTAQQPKPYFFNEFRFVKLGVNDEVLGYSRTFAGGFSLNTCGQQTTDFTHLTSQGILDSEFNLYEENGIPNNGALPEHLVGAYVPMHGVPYFGEGDPNEGTLDMNGAPASAYEGPPQ